MLLLWRCGLRNARCQRKPGKAALAATGWALLGMMSYEEEVSGYDLKKWID